MTSQLNYLIAQQRQAELVSRAEETRPASEAHLAQVEARYDRCLATEEPRPVRPHAGPLAEAPAYPSLCAHGMNSLTDRGYELALGRLPRG